jgi:hypothetical protein
MGLLPFFFLSLPITQDLKANQLPSYSLPKLECDQNSMGGFPWYEGFSFALVLGTINEPWESTSRILVLAAFYSTRTPKILRPPQPLLLLPSLPLFFGLRWILRNRILRGSRTSNSDRVGSCKRRLRLNRVLLMLSARPLQGYPFI